MKFMFLIVILFASSPLSAAPPGDIKVMHWEDRIYFKSDVYCYYTTVDRLKSLKSYWFKFTHITSVPKDGYSDEFKPCFFERGWVVAKSRYTTRPVRSTETDKIVGRAPVGSPCKGFWRASSANRQFRIHTKEPPTYTLCELDWYYPLSGSIN